MYINITIKFHQITVSPRKASNKSKGMAENRHGEWKLVRKRRFSPTVPFKIVGFPTNSPWTEGC